jgi:two-component system chemotaxis response regulator CheB
LEKAAVIVIGGSAGSIQVVIQILQSLPASFNTPIIIVIHRGSVDSELDVLLQSYSHLIVKDADDKEQIMKGVVYLAPADYHLLLEHNGTLSLDDSEKIHWSRPAIDATFETAADCCKSSLMAILLSGANTDGTQGLKEVSAMGGVAVVQSPDEAEVNYMPISAIREMPNIKVAGNKEIIELMIAWEG